jgi:Uma2 family endonuclease
MPVVHDGRNVSFDEYLRLEEASEERHEYVAGRLYAMVGGTATHNIVTSNIHVALYAKLGGTPCRAFRENMKLRIRQFEDYRSFYPDIFVACNPGDNHPLFRDEPLLVVEVLSDGTERSDIEEKLPLYRQIPSLEEILYVDSRRVGWTLFRRATGWAPEASGRAPESVVSIPSLGFEMTLGDVYRDTGLIGH